MPPIVATACCCVLILALFILDRDRHAHTSRALWIPVLWLMMIASRPLSSWMAVFGLAEQPVFDRPDQLVEGSPADRLAFLVLIALGATVLMFRQRRLAALLASNGPAMLFLLYCAASTLWADYPLVALKRWIKAAGDFIMVAIVVTDREPVTAVKRLFTRTGFVLVPLSVLFIKFYPDLGRAYHVWSWTPMYTGVTTGKNLLGVKCLVVGTASLWCILAALRTSRGFERWQRLAAHVTLLAMVAWLLWMANSLTAIMCLTMATAVMVVTCSRAVTRNAAVIHLMTAGIVLACAWALFTGEAGSAVTSLGRDPTLTGRTGIWSMVISMRENALFGAGFESFWMGERLARMWTVDDGAFVGIQSAHNGYLEVFVNIGLAGVSCLAFVLLTGYTRIIRSVQRDPEIHRLSLGFFIVTLVYNFSEAGFRMVTPIWLTFLLALMLSTHHPSSAHRIAMSPRRRRYVNQNGDRTSAVRVNAHAGQL